MHFAKSIQTVPVTKTTLVFSDVHGNTPALHAALDYSREAGVTDVISLGDMVDYNPHGNEVMALLKNELQLVTAIQGNHEADIEETWDGTFKSGFSYEDFETDLAEWATTLPLQSGISLPDGRKILLTHSNPWNNVYEYLFPQDKVNIELFLEDVKPFWDGFWFGHTHMATFHKKNGIHAFNPGSLGISRTNAPELTFAWLDPNEGTLTVYAIEHDKESDMILVGEPWEKKNEKF